MRRERTHNELRCFCSRRPLLAVYGLDKDRHLYVHVRIYKQQRIFGEVIITDGTVRLHCRECLRWHKVIIKQPNSLGLIEETDPPIPAVEV
jgi:hypothetical protein